MKAGLSIWRCKACEKPVFPQRIFCPSCGGSDWREEVAATGRVEEVSLIHHMIGQENWQKRRIANVSTDAGIPVTAGLLDDAGEGDEVSLFDDNGAAFARRAD